MATRLLVLFLSTISFASTFSQDKVVIDQPDVIVGILVKTTLPLKEIANTTSTQKSKPKKRKPKPGYHPKNDWILHDKVNPHALPIEEDPVRQKVYNNKKLKAAATKSFAGIDYTFVDPADPSMAAGPNHVVQMVNGEDGGLIKIWDKQGNVIASQFLMDDITGIDGSGDPIVIYDHIADRWLLTEFGDSDVQSVGNRLICMVSQTSDPMGAYYVYSFVTPEFPDYPKYGLWPNAYLVTTNEDSYQAVYAMDRAKMIAGNNTATMQRFTNIDLFQTIGFQASTPVSLSGTTLPTAQSPGIIMRMADDGWQGVANDRLEYWELNLDFNNSSNSNLSGPTYLNTEPFDTNLCGFSSFSCIKQPGVNSERLDPLREVLMNRIHYRNFGSYEAIVCSHATDIGSDVAGVRWYELRRTGTNPWSIHQQGTYAPNDGDSRWMSSIAINSEGSIGLAYNRSSSNTFPSIGFTGRKECDPLGQMTMIEEIGIAGTASNLSNRYGDYNDMSVDPSDGSFWFTGKYNTSGDWSTRLLSFSIVSDCNSSNCDTPTDLNGTIADGTYHFGTELSSSGTVPANGNVTFKSHVEVNLMPNFMVTQLGILAVYIENCNQ